MDILQAIILSVVEGLSEFLPISSTAHLVMAAKVLAVPQTEFVKSFEIFIQLGAILAVGVLYIKKFIRDIEVWKRVVVAFIPTSIVGLLLYKTIKSLLIGNLVVTLWAILFGGIALIILELIYKEKSHHVSSIKDLTLPQAFLIGLVQSLSVIPGVSRAGATIIGGLFLGAKRSVAVEFSFLLAVPILMAATGLDLIKMNFSFTGEEWLLLIIGLMGAFGSALLVIKWFLKYVQTNNFIIFGVYRILLAVIFWLIFVK